VHDALGRRVGRVVNGVFERGWLYKDSLNPIAQVNAAGVVEATYVYVTRANVPDYIVTTAGAVYRVVSDHLGSVRMLVNATTGAVVERYDYDVWGRVTFESGDHSLHPVRVRGRASTTRTRAWCGFGVRDYDADAGRWTAPEPLGFAAEANWYRYATGGRSVYGHFYATRAALDGHVEQDVLGVVQTSYAVDVSAATPGYGDYEGSTVRVNGTPVYESHYEHDALGRITEWTETVEGSTRVQRFEYDDGGPPHERARRPRRAGGGLRLRPEREPHERGGARPGARAGYPFGESRP
jgi:RHS repeat-associated protein